MFAELMAVVGMANITNLLAHGYQIPIDDRFRSSAPEVGNDCEPPWQQSRQAPPVANGSSPGGLLGQLRTGAKAVDPHSYVSKACQRD
jgi:hypothetical protein